VIHTGDQLLGDTSISNTKLEKTSTLPVGLHQQVFQVVRYTGLCFQGVLSHRLCLSYNPFHMDKSNIESKLSEVCVNNMEGMGFILRRSSIQEPCHIQNKLLDSIQKPHKHTEQAIQCNTMPIHFQQPSRRSLASFPGIPQVIKYWRWERPGNDARESQWCAPLF